MFTCYWFYIQNKPILVYFRMFFCHFGNVHHVHHKLPWGEVLKIAQLVEMPLAFMELEDLLLCLCPEPEEANPVSLKSILSIFNIIILSVPSNMFPSDFLAAVLFACHICSVCVTCSTITHLDWIILMIFFEGPNCKVPQSPALCISSSVFKYVCQHYVLKWPQYLLHALTK